MLSTCLYIYINIYIYFYICFSSIHSDKFHKISQVGRPYCREAGSRLTKKKCSDRQLKIIFFYREIPMLRHIFMEINLRINSKFTYLTFVIYKACLSQLYHTCMKHKWGGYLHFTTIIPIKTVCKQFINGSVPFDYSLNSGFDTGMTADFAETLYRKCLRGGGREWAQELSSLPAGSRLLDTERKRSKGSTVGLYPILSWSRSLRLNPRVTTDIVLTKCFK